MNLHEWAARWGIPGAALTELSTYVFNHDPNSESLAAAPSLPGRRIIGETATTAAIRVEAAQKGLRLFRNNVGATYDTQGRFIRYGLANDSAALNKKIKSSDLIGLRPIVIEQHHVGSRLGQFVSRDVKAPGWTYTATEREQAQQRWIELIIGLGGDAAFASGPGTL